MAVSLFWFIAVDNLFLAFPVIFDLWKRMFSQRCYEPSFNSGFLVCCIPRKHWLLVFIPCILFYCCFFFLQGDLIISMILKVNELRITVLTQISTAALIKISTLQMQHLFETIWYAWIFWNHDMLILHEIVNSLAFSHFPAYLTYQHRLCLLFCIVYIGPKAEEGNGFQVTKSSVLFVIMTLWQNLVSPFVWDLLVTSLRFKMFA